MFILINTMHSHSSSQAEILGTVGGISWTLGGSAVCVWDRALDKCQLQVYEASINR